jgi:anti-sigma factor RsiW
MAMKCDSVGTLLGQYMDGELPPHQVALVEAELEHCERCQAELADLIAMRDAFRAPVLEAAQTVSFEGLWDRIAADLAAPGSAPKEAISPVPMPGRTSDSERPSVWARIMEAVRRTFAEQPLIPIGAAAAVAAAVVASVLMPAETERTSAPVAPGAAELSAVKPNEPAPALDEENNRAWISSVQYTKGVVIIDQIPDDPTQPTIVWHYDETATDEEVQGG